MTAREVVSPPVPSRCAGWARACRVVLCLLASAIGCGTEPAPPPPLLGASLEEGVVARVGDVSVSAATVGRIAAAQGVDRQRAVELAVREALFEADARRRGLLDPASPAFDTTLAHRVRMELAKVVLASTRARVEGPTTPEEVQALLARHWLDVRRPDGVRTVHVVACWRDDCKPPTEADKTDARRAAMEALAAELRAAALPVVEELSVAPPVVRYPGRTATSPITARLTQVLPSIIRRSGLRGRVEELNPFSAEGLLLQPEKGTLDPGYVEGALKLRERGDVSEPVWSQFGLHVIVLLERVPGNMVPEAELPTLFHDEAVTERARAMHQELLTRLRSEVRLELVGGVDALLEEVDVRAPSAALGMDDARGPIP